jgi:hypothetical protein
MNYPEFLQAKIKLAPTFGFSIDESSINPALKPHQRAMVKWLVDGGRRACFAAFGMGKSIIQLETVRLTLAQVGGRGLIVAPLGVRQEFKRDAIEILGWEEAPRFVRSLEECDETGIYLTNYETVRDGKLAPRQFEVASLDEASVLRGFGGTKTFREFMRLFTGDAGPLSGKRNGADGVPYRFVATATPSPNDYIELLSYAAFLGIMDVAGAKTRFFKRDSTKADKLTLHPHKAREFWLWVASWALFVQSPADLGFDATGYDMPPLDLHWHEVPVDHTKDAGMEKWGQTRLFRDAAIGVQDAAKEKRLSLGARIEKMQEIRALDPSAHRILWHDLEAEREAIESAVPGVVSVYGSQDDAAKEEAIIGFSNGDFQEIAGKPVMLGSGVNFQRHCNWAIFLGIGFKFNDFIQAIHRLQRFGQEKTVRVDLIYTESEREIRKALEKKWAQHEEMTKQMTSIIQEFGLSKAAMAHTLTRKLGIERVEVMGERYRLVNNDNVLETAALPDNSVGLIVSSIPFSNQYEYSPNYADFGHTDDPKHFFEQMDYLTPELFRALQPGRVAAIHVKDRIMPTGLSDVGFQTVYPFHADCISHYTKHGFGFLGMKTIVTDVVRENNQTYRLGWTEQCKDGSKMGVGMPEYLLLFRKPPTDKSNGYADLPVQKSKPLQERPDGTTQPFDKDSDLPIVPGSGYSRARWQIDAHGYTRSAGNRYLTPGELHHLSHTQIFRLFRDFCLETVYDFEHHVLIGETLEARFQLPSDFMLLQPPSWSDEVWTDVTRMLTLNGSQWSKGKEMHLCPMQFDIADRVVAQFSNPGDVVLDPFSGLGTVPMRAILQGRQGLGFELNPAYFLDSVGYVRAAAEKVSMPTLFDLSELEMAA